MLEYYSGTDNPHYDRAKARAELAQCPDRTTRFGLKYLSAQRNEFSAIGTMLAALRMNVKLEPLSSADWWKVVGASPTLDATNTHIVSDGWLQDYPDPHDYCTVLLNILMRVDGWHNASYERLVDQADTMLDPKKRARLYIQAQHLAISRGVWISLNNDSVFELTKPYVRGLVGTEAFSWLQPKNGDWANVTVSRH